jgi:hypothetical protein
VAKKRRDPTDPPRFKRGDRVRVKPDAYPARDSILGECGRVVISERGRVVWRVTVALDGRDELYVMDEGCLAPEAT